MRELQNLLKKALPVIQAAWPPQNLSAHDTLTLHACLQDAKDITHHRYTGGIVTAHINAYKLTPLLQAGLTDGRVRSRLFDEGYTNFAAAWESVFSDFEDKTGQKVRKTARGDGK